MIQPLRFEDEVLLILDQRRLPAEQAWLRCERPEEVAEAIRTLAVRGAPAIGLAAAYGLALALDGAERCVEEGRSKIEDAERVLLATRPTAVNLGWALERGREAYAAAEGSGDEREAVLELAQRLHAEQDAADRRLAEHGAERFAAGDRALTHCNTGPLATGGYGTAGGVLRAAFDRGRLEQVWVSETRPLRQGARLTAWELAQEGIPFQVVTDSSAGALMGRGQVDRIVVGADRIARNGDVANKIGTYPLAVLAQRHELPFLVAAPLSTIDPGTADGGAIPIEERDPGEVVEGMPALNLAFDVTPAELITAIVTEAGILEPPYEQSIARALGG